MPDIYTQHHTAFAHVEAHAILKDGHQVATIAFKFPRDGAGRLYAYAHWIGLEMVRGHASGGGYDKRTAACASAAGKMPFEYPQDSKPYHAFNVALSRDNGMSWDRQLREAGFDVLQAV